MLIDALQLETREIRYEAEDLMLGTGDADNDQEEDLTAKMKQVCLVMRNEGQERDSPC